VYAQVAKVPATRPAPTSSGQLARTPFAHLLVYAHDKQLSGTFDFRAVDGTTASVLVVAGRPAKVQLSGTAVYLGQVLLELGMIDSPTLDASLLAMSKERALHGSILVARGAITTEQLEEGLRAQIRRKLALIALLPPTTAFEFYADFDGLSDFGGAPTPDDPFPSVWGAIRTHPSLEHAKAALDRVAQGRLRLTRAAQIERLGLSAEERRWVELVSMRPLRLDEFFANAEIGDRLARLLVYCLAITKQIELVGDEEPTSSNRGAAVAVAEAPPISSSGIPSAAPSSPKTVGRITLRQSRHRTQPVIEESVVRAAADSRQTPPPGAVQAQTADIVARRKEIQDLAAVIDKQNYFEMLGLAPEATIDDVKNAYFQLAKRWHPDRLPSALADVRDPCARVFARLSEAFQTLSDPDTRTRYARLMKEGGETPEQQQEIANVVSAAVEFQKAEICLKKNDLAQAEELATRAVRMDPNQADYRALLTWLQALKPEAQSPEATQVKIEALDEALKMNARCERAYLYRAMLYKRQHRDGVAFKDFKKVVELNPKNIDAQREIRLYEMRGGAPPPPAAPSSPSEASSKPGLFQKLFKK
jgi:tetratricopeptide (TPR) repeat protein